MFTPREELVMHLETTKVVQDNLTGMATDSDEMETPGQSDFRWNDRVASFLATRDKLRAQVTMERLKDQYREIEKALQHRQPYEKRDVVLVRGHDIDAQKGRKWSER